MIYVIVKQVMLLGHSDSYTRDKQMQVTIAYNHFGEGLIQRMPRYSNALFYLVLINENDFPRKIEQAASFNDVRLAYVVAEKICFLTINSQKKIR